MYETSVLPNGVAFVSDMVNTSRVCAIGFRFAVGSRHEEPGQNGITHFVEHLLFKGTRTRTAFDIAAAFDRIGGYLNAYTERECVMVYAVVPALHAEKAVEILCDMTEHSLFLAAEIEKEREVIVSEIETSRDDAEEAALDAAACAVFPGQRISASISGIEETVRRLCREELFDWYRTHIVQGELAVYVAGNTESGSAEDCTGFTALKRRVASLPARKGRRESPEMPRWSPGAHFVEAAFQQEQFFFLTPLPYPLTEKRYYGWAILNALIGDTMSSRLFQLLREESGFCYTVYSTCTFYADTGLWFAYASSARKNGAAMAKSLTDALHSLAATGPGDDEILAAQEHLCGEEIIFAEDMEYRMKHLVRTHQSGFTPCNPQGVIHTVRDMGVGELRKLLGEMLTFEQAALVVYGPRLTEKTKNLIRGCADRLR
jgi:predicted Zn-dependent peptidase